MTTDFLITVNNDQQHQFLARTLKYKDDLMDERVLEKFEIERVYWERQNVDWGIVTELEIPKGMAHNIEFVHGYSNLFVIEGFEEVTSYEIDDMSIYFIKKLLMEDKTVKQIAKEFDCDFGMVIGCGLSLFKHLVITKAIELNLLDQLNVNKIQQIKAVRRDFSEKVKAI